MSDSTFLLFLKNNCSIFGSDEEKMPVWKLEKQFIRDMLPEKADRMSD
jgi:hypothetical protein